MLNKIKLRLHKELGIPDDFASETELPAYAQTDDLVEVGPNLVGRMQRLTPTAAAKWQKMVDAAANDGIRLLIVSGYRSFGYQGDLIKNKLDKGQKIEDILKVNAAPGYSQHHTGEAIDIASPGSRPLTEDFETSEAFAWLSENAKTHGFSMTYPRDNQYGIIYEPWHWALGDC
jgi:D-alanyl-D-alanine carboxypeptidase